MVMISPETIEMLGRIYHGNVVDPITLICYLGIVSCLAEILQDKP